MAAPTGDEPAPVPAVEDPDVPAAVAARRDEVPWRGWDALLIGLAYLIAALPVYVLVPGALDPDADPVPLLDTGLLLVVTLAWLRLVRGAGAPRRVLGPRGDVPPRARSVLWGLGLGVAAVLLDVAVFALLDAVGQDLPPVQEHLVAWLSGTPMPALVVADVVALTPVAEEVFFRGVLFQGLARRWGAWAAAVASGLLFGAAHIESGGLDSVFLFVSTGAFGVGCAWLLHRRRTLLAPLAAHVLVNAVGTAGLLAS